MSLNFWFLILDVENNIRFSKTNDKVLPWIMLSQEPTARQREMLSDTMNHWSAWKNDPTNLDRCLLYGRSLGFLFRDLEPCMLRNRNNVLMNADLAFNVMAHHMRAWVEKQGVER